MSLRPIAKCAFFNWQASSYKSLECFVRRLPVTASDSSVGVMSGISSALRTLSIDGGLSSKLNIRRAQTSTPAVYGPLLSRLLSSQPSRQYHVGASSNLLSPRFSGLQISQPQQQRLLPVPSTPLLNVTRSVTKFSLRKGRRKTAVGVKSRFFRLDWGGWISTKPGAERHLWKQSIQRRNRLRQHMFRNNTECKTLDKMVTKYWIKKKFFVDDPYESYHTRDNFRITKGVRGIQTTWLRKIKKYDPLRKPY